MIDMKNATAVKAAMAREGTPMHKSVTRSNGHVSRMEFREFTTSEAERVIADSEDAGNRTPSHHRVLTIAQDMMDGRWRGDDSVVVLTEDGKLLDGRHRFGACVLSGVPLVTWVRTVPSGTSVHDLRVDLGGKRRVAFILGIDKDLAAAGRMLYYAATTMHPSVDVLGDVTDIIAPEFYELTKSHRVGVTAAHRAATMLAMWRYPRDRAAIAEQYNNLANLDLAGLWPPVMSAVRSMFEKTTPGGESPVREKFVRLFLAYDPRRRSSSQVRLTKGVPEYIADMRPIMKKYIGVNES